jgi:hypothetical protein
MKNWDRSICSGLLHFIILSSALYAQTILNVGETPIQTWQGFGANFLPIESVNNTYNGLSGEKKAEFNRTMWEGADIIAARLWDYQDSYTNDPVLRDAIALGGILEVKIASVGCYYQDGSGCGERNPEAHGDYWARMVIKYRNNGIPITALGIKNKMNTTGSGSAWRSNPETIGDYVVAMRAALNSRNMQDVKIIAPEAVVWDPWPSVVDGDKYNFQPGDDTLYLKYISQDARMKNSLYAFGSQTYGKGVSARMQQMVQSWNKPFWQTIGSPFAKDFSQNDHYLKESGSLVAGSILGDMNHGVSLWFYWSTDNLFKLDFSGYSPKWHFMNTIAKATDPGMQVLAVNAPSLAASDMPFHMGNYSPLNSTAGINPDGSIALAVVNMEGLSGGPWQVSFNSTNNSAKSVQFKIPSIENIPSVAFTLWRIKENQEGVTQTQVFASYGTINLEILPLELVAMRSAAGIIGGGLPPIQDTLKLDPGQILEAESAKFLTGLTVKPGSGLGYSNIGDAAGWGIVKFSQPVCAASISYGVPIDFAGNILELRTGSPSGELLGHIITQSSGNWDIWREDSFALSRCITDLEDLWLVFADGGGGDWVADVNFMRFESSSLAPVTNAINRLPFTETSKNIRLIADVHTGVRIYVPQKGEFSIKGAHF